MTLKKVLLTLSPLERKYYTQRYTETKRLIAGRLPSNEPLVIDKRLQSQLLQLRQIVCHPQIVKRDDQLLGSKQRLSMGEIMQRVRACCGVVVVWVRGWQSSPCVLVACACS